MSQLIKSVLSRSFLLHRALAVRHLNSHTQLVRPCMASLISKRFFVSQSPPSKFGEAQTSELDYDDRPDIKLGKSYGYNKNFTGSNNNRFSSRQQQPRHTSEVTYKEFLLRKFR